MPTFEELLRASLRGANEKFDQADQTLHAAVAETAKAVDAVTEGKAMLRLVQRSRSDDSTRYELVVSQRAGNEPRQLAMLNVTKTGFPIERLGPYMRDGEPRGFVIQEEFDSAEKVAIYFKKLVSDQNSPLVAYLAYIVRTPVQPAPGDGDPIPF